MLTDQQKEAIESTSTKILVRAGAGTGKTEVLTRRVIRLLDQDPDLTIRNFAIITFTNKATENVRDRLKKYLYIHWRNTRDPLKRDMYRSQLETLNLGQISTIHKFCSVILDYAGPSQVEAGVDFAPGYRVSESSVRSAVSTVVERWLSEDNNDQNPLRTIFPTHMLRQTVLQAYNLIRNKGLNFKQVVEETRMTMSLKDDGDVSRIKRSLIQLLTQLKTEVAKQRLYTLSTDGLLEYAAKLLRKRPELVERVQNRFRHLVVDEFQDTSTFQTEILQLLCETGSRPCSLFVVGDLKQSVYQFRGADLKSYKNVEEWIRREGIVLSLSTNFRSVKPLVSYVNGTFRRFQEDTQLPIFEAEDLLTNDNSEEEIDDVVHKIYYEGRSPEERTAELILNEINKGALYKDFAVLFRTNRLMDIYFNALIKAGISAQMIGAGNLFARKEIADIYRILNYLLSPQDNVKREEALYADLINGNSELLSCLLIELKPFSFSFTVAQVIEKIIAITEARKYYSENLNVQAIANMERLKEITRDSGNGESFQLVDYVKWLGIQILTNRDEKQAELDDEKMDAVQLITVHRAKGLEFPYVILTELDRDLSSPSLIPTIIHQNESGLEFRFRYPTERYYISSNQFDLVSKLYKQDYLAEEARVLYVAMTRAEKKIYLLINENVDKKVLCYQKWLIGNGLMQTHHLEEGGIKVNNPEIKALETSEKWIHQTKAREIFVQKQHGILEMATGTGKTKTAIDIINQLLAENKINSAVITVDGTDLLDQWYKQMVRDTTLNLFRHYDKHKQIAPFSLHPQGSVLLISRKALGELFTNMPGSFYKKAIFVADEVHGIGSETKVRKFKGKINKFEYTLGLSATPDRAYDADGNRFIEEEIGSVIYEFKLQDAIRKGILCEFKYVPLDFQLTEEDRAERKRIIAAYYAGISNGRPVSIERFYTDLARVKKEAQGKIPVFKSFIEENPALLKRSIIFVETIEFGQKIQEIILPLISNYHTYFGDDDRKNLERFSKGEIDCLLAAKRISEGIDIRSVHNIILLTADRAKLQTIQRIGRSLRTDPKNPDKKATVVDFIEDAELQSMDSDEESELTADQARRAWLTEISNVGREQ